VLAKETGHVYTFSRNYLRRKYVNSSHHQGVGSFNMALLGKLKDPKSLVISEQSQGFPYGWYTLTLEVSLAFFGLFP
jgi:hypothetical protein